MGSLSLKMKRLPEGMVLARLELWVPEGGALVSANLAGDTEEILMLVHIPWWRVSGADTEYWCLGSVALENMGSCTLTPVSSSHFYNCIAILWILFSAGMKSEHGTSPFRHPPFFLAHIIFNCKSNSHILLFLFLIWLRTQGMQRTLFVRQQLPGTRSPYNGS